MPYVDIGQVGLFFKEAGSGGIPALLLHELGGSSESWREVIPRLASDRRVIAVDFRAPADRKNRSAPSSYPILPTILRLCCKRWASPIGWT